MTVDTKVTFKPGTMLYPLPAVMVSLGSEKTEHNILTISWTGILCSDPPITYISVRKERHSHPILMREREFVINLTTQSLVKETDFCGVKSGRLHNKFEEMKLEKIYGDHVKCPMIKACPVNIECRVTEIKELGSHDMFMADILAVHADASLMNEKNKLLLNQSGLLTYSHGEYLGLSPKVLGTFGYSIMKPKTRKRRAAAKKLSHSR